MQNLEIKLNIDDSQAKRATASWLASMQKAEAAAGRSATAAERAFKRKQDAADRAAQRLLQASQRELSAAQKSLDAIERANKKQADSAEKLSVKQAEVAEKNAKRAADAVARAAQKAAEAQAKFDEDSVKSALKATEAKRRAVLKAMDDARRASEKSIEADKRAGDAKVKAEADRISKLQALGKEHLSKEEIQLRARAVFNQKMNQQKIDDAVKALGQEKQGWTSLGGVVGGVGKAVLAAGAAYLTLEVGKQIVFGLAEAWAAQRKDLETSVLRVTDYQRKLLELADLKNRLGRTTPELAAQLKLRGQTTQTADDAQKFNEGILNSGQVAVQGGLINKNEFDKLTVMGGKAQAAKGIAAETAGNFFGGLPALFGGQNQKADDVAARGLAITGILQAGGSSAASGVNQYQGIASLAKTGSFGSADVAPEKLAATQAYFSLAKKDAAGTMVEQYQRATTGALDRTRRGGIDGGVAQGQYLDTIGAKVGMKSEDISRLVASDVSKQRKADPNFNLDNYLGKHGWGNSDDRLVMGNVVTGIENGQFDTFMKMADPAKRPGIAEAMKPIDDALRVDPTAIQRKADVAQDAAAASRSVGAPQRLLQARRMAFYRLQADKKVGAGSFESYNDSNIYSGIIQDEVQREIFERAKKAGIDTSEYGSTAQRNKFDNAANAMFGSGAQSGVLGGSPTSRMAYSDDTRAIRYEELDAKIAAKTGEVISIQPIIDVMNKNVDAAIRIENAVRDGNRQNKPADKAPVQLNAGPPTN